MYAKSGQLSTALVLGEALHHNADILFITFTNSAVQNFCLWSAAAELLETQILHFRTSAFLQKGLLIVCNIILLLLKWKGISPKMTLEPFYLKITVKNILHYFKNWSTALVKENKFTAVLTILSILTILPIFIYCNPYNSDIYASLIHSC